MAVHGASRANSSRNANNFEPPPGYVPAHLSSDETASRDDEVWVVRVPDGVDARALDGVTIPLEALESASSSPLASVRVSETDAYDVLQARVSSSSSSKAPSSAQPPTSQLIEMAAPTTTGHVFLDEEFLRSEQNAGVAAELQSICALMPSGSNGSSLRMTPVSRRLYMARQAPSSLYPQGIPVPVPPKHKQPWDRLQGVFHPAGSQRNAPASRAKDPDDVDRGGNEHDADEVDADAEASTQGADAKLDKAQKKRKKEAGEDSSKAEKKKKKKQKS